MHHSGCAPNPFHGHQGRSWGSLMQRGTGNKRMAGARHLEAGPNIKEGSDERHFLTFSTWSMALWTATKVSTLSSEIIKASHPASHEVRLLVPQTVQNVSAHFSAMLHMGWRDQCTKHLQMQQPAGHSEPALCPNKCHRAMLTWIAAWLHKGLGPGEEVQQLPQRCAAHSGQAPPWQRQGTITSRTRHSSPYRHVSDQPGAFAQPHLSCSHATSGAGEAQKTVTRTRNACKRIGSKCVVMSACLARRGERSDAHPQRRRRAGCSGGRRPAPASCAGSPWPPWRSCAAPTEHLHRTLHSSDANLKTSLCRFHRVP